MPHHHNMFSTAGQRLLRKCRSEKKLREPQHHIRKDSIVSNSSFSSDATATTHNDDDDHHHHHHQHYNHCSHGSHQRHPSDWDPLRLHPPMDVDRSPYMTVARPVPLPNGDHYDDMDDDDLQSPDDHDDMEDIFTRTGMTALRPPPPPPPSARRPLFRRMKTAEMDVHEGFDFGFAAANQDGHRHDDHLTVPPLPRPSTSSTLASDHSGSSWLHLDCSPDNTPSMPLPSPRSRRPPSTAPDSPAHLIRRGEWKRRGIVFISEDAKVTEEDCFDIP